MDAAKGHEEEELDEGGVVVVPYATVDPRAVVVHLHHTSDDKKKH